MEMRKTKMLVLFSLVLGSAACMDQSPVAPTDDALAAAKAPAAPRSSLPTIVGIAASNPDFEILVAAVQATGLVDVLNGNQHYTVFAPTDAAFQATFGAECATVQGCVNYLVAAVGVDGIRDVLLYHVTRGDRISTAVVNAGKVQMLNGQTAHVTVQNGTAYIANTPIVATDIKASNGVVHVLGGVMLP